MLMTEKNMWLGQVPLRRLAGGAPTVLTDATYSQALSAPKAVVDFWSPSCPACMAYKPVFEEVAAQTGSDILMATVNVNDSMQSAGGYQIQGIPATIFLVNGKEVHRVEGGMEKADLQGEIARAFSGGGGAITQSGVSVPASSGLPLGTILIGGLTLAGLIAAGVYLLGRK